MAELHYLQALDTPEAKFEVQAKLCELKLAMDQFTKEQKMTFDWGNRQLQQF